MLKVSARSFPIGFIISVDAPDFNPNDFYIDGVWEQIKGRVIVGVDEAQTEFDTTGKKGGSKTHTLTVNEMPQHSHDVMTTLIHVDGPIVTDEYINANLAYGEARRRYHNTVSDTGGNQPHNNLQPYQTAYMWKLISYSN